MGNYLWGYLRPYHNLHQTRWLWIIQSTRIEIIDQRRVCRHHPRTRSSSLPYLQFKFRVLNIYACKPFLQSNNNLSVTQAQSLFLMSRGWYCSPQQTTSDFLTSLTNPAKWQPLPSWESTSQGPQMNLLDSGGRVQRGWCWCGRSRSMKGVIQWKVVRDWEHLGRVGRQRRLSICMSLPPSPFPFWKC